MVDDVAASNVNRVYSLAATSIAIFTFTLIFLYPRFTSGEANPVLFQAVVVVMAAATFSFVFATLQYYGSSLGGRTGAGERAAYARRGDRFWVLGSSLRYLAPGLVLLSVGLYIAGAVWLALWLSYLLFVTRYFPRVQSQ
jgi:hypothetical protein